MLATPRAIPVRMRIFGACLPPLVAGLLVATAVTASSAPLPGSAPLDTADRAAVAAAYQNTYLPAMAVQAPNPPADTAATCNAGVPPTALQDATLDLVNYFRSMSGVGRVTFDPGYSAKAQKAALISYVNGSLDRAPAAGTSRCYSTAGEEALVSSNIALGHAGADVVRSYMDDAGDGGASGGQRWWLQRPSTQTMGSGTLGWANALWVDGTRATVDGPRWTSWPPAGWLPADLEPQGRWSLTPWDPDFDLSQATVTVTGPDGQPVPVTAHPVNRAYGSLVFELGALPAVTGTQVDTYSVTVANILRRHEPVAPYTYDVRLFDPAADAPPPLESSAAPAVTGSAVVGETLTATAPTWSVAETATSYQWYRGSVAIEGATGTTLTLGPADVDHPVTVRATGRAPGRAALTVSSEPTAPVARVGAALAVRASSSAVGKLALSVAVTAAGDAAPGGTVTIQEGTRTVKAGLTLTRGAASWSATGLKPGAHTYTVTYSGDDRTQAATATVSATVRAKVSPTLSLAGTSSAKGRVSVATTVKASGQTGLTGTVTVKEGSKTLKSGIKVSGGKATWSATKVKAGKHTYTVSYSGTSEVNSGSAKVTVKVR